MAENEIITIAIEDLEDFLAGITASKLSLKITGITSGNLNMIKAALSNNPTVYVDLSSTNIPNSVTNMSDCFYGCTSLVEAPVIPNSVTNMYSCFYNCSKLVEAPNIPNSVTSMRYCFYSCTSLHTIHNWQVKDLSQVDMINCFSGCTSLQNIFVTEPKVNKYSLCYADINDTTANCTFVNTDGEQSFSVVSNKLVIDGMIDELAIGTSLTKDKALELYRYRVPFSNNSKDFSPDDPHMVLWAKNKDKVKSNVVDAGLTIDTALSPTSENPVQNKVIDEALVGKAWRYIIAGAGGNTAYARITLSAYTELITSCYTTQIIFKAGVGGSNGEISNCIPLFYGGYGIQGWYSTSYTDTTRPRTLYLKFGSWSDIDIIASNAITIERSTTDYLAADFPGVAYKDIPRITKQLSNDLLHTVDSYLSNASTNPVQSKAIYSALSSYSKLELTSLWSGSSSVNAQTLTLSQPYTAFKFIIVEGCAYNEPNSQRMYAWIPSSQCSINVSGDGDEFLLCGSTADTNRRIRFCFPTTTTLYKTASDGTSNHKPIITNVWGLK